MSFSDQNLSVVRRHYRRRCRGWRRHRCYRKPFTFFSRITGSISTKFGTKHTWVKAIQVFFLMKSPALFHWEIIMKQKKYIDEILKKIFFSRTTGTSGPISTKLGTKHFWVMGNQVCSNEGPCPFPRGDN